MTDEVHSQNAAVNSRSFRAQERAGPLSPALSYLLDLCDVGKFFAALQNQRGPFLYPLHVGVAVDERAPGSPSTSIQKGL